MDTDTVPKRTCAIAGDQIDLGDELGSCSICGALGHLDCWKDLDECPRCSTDVRQCLVRRTPMLGSAYLRAVEGTPRPVPADENQPPAATAVPLPPLISLPPLDVVTCSHGEAVFTPGGFSPCPRCVEEAVVHAAGPLRPRAVSGPDPSALERSDASVAAPVCVRLAAGWMKLVGVSTWIVTVAFLRGLPGFEALAVAEAFSQTLLIGLALGVVVGVYLIRIGTRLRRGDRAAWRIATVVFVLHLAVRWVWLAGLLGLVALNLPRSRAHFRGPYSFPVSRGTRRA